MKDLRKELTKIETEVNQFSKELMKLRVKIYLNIIFIVFILILVLGVFISPPIIMWLKAL